MIRFYQDFAVNKQRMMIRLSRFSSNETNSGDKTLRQVFAVKKQGLTKTVLSCFLISWVLIHSFSIMAVSKSTFLYLNHQVDMIFTNIHSSKMVIIDTTVDKGAWFRFAKR